MNTELDQQGGNQLRQPYIRNSFKGIFKKYINTEHIHFYSLYIGNYPDLKRKDLDFIIKVLNAKIKIILKKSFLLDKFFY